MIEVERHYADVLQRDCRPASALLVEALRRRAGLPDSRLGEGAEEVDPTTLLHVARLNQVTLALATLRDWTGFEAIAPTVDMTRLRTVAINRKGLALTRRIAAEFEAAGLPYLVLKGPLSQVTLYGDPCVKPSGDSDFYVGAGDLPTARRILAQQGFKGGGGNLSAWWIHGLGEQHFQDDAGNVVDLHHRLQQPGGVRLRDEEQVLTEREIQSFEGAQYTVPSSHDVICLTAISLTRALYGREPGGRYLLDLARISRDLAPDQLSDLLAHAKAQGIEGTILFALQLTCAVLGPLPIVLPRHPLSLEDCALREMALIPWTSGLPWPRRRELLWLFCERRPFPFLAEAGRSGMADVLRRILS
ncbi:nucleotidyltransferase family protein [Pseudoroseicyclus tamaricis]|uniref:Nucleotidyltransferase family protein n=1 Tax=Pseudoroseicyclus tamaricis TaxID=2705421 RepID=A0A6B2JIV9_9RHOB|nr:nucleotidyltransferase family protein [Pseudoroseicyclus tamaricis]NDV01343.1 nucleotidyltransferase family protein [Pseudoroseicyclus tamaricis]